MSLLTWKYEGKPFSCPMSEVGHCGRCHRKNCVVPVFGEFKQNAAGADAVCLMCGASHANPPPMEQRQ